MKLSNRNLLLILGALVVVYYLKGQQKTEQAKDQVGGAQTGSGGGGSLGFTPTGEDSSNTLSQDPTTEVVFAGDQVMPILIGQESGMASVPERSTVARPTFEDSYKPSATFQLL